MAIGTGFLNIGRLFIQARSNERLYTNTISAPSYIWNTTASGLYGKGPNGNHPNIDEAVSGDGTHWGRLFKGDSGNLGLTKKACSGFISLAYQKLKKIRTDEIISSAQYDSGINQYRFYNYIKRSNQSLYGVKEVVQDVNISQYEQNYGKSLTKIVQIDVYSYGIYNDATKTTELSGTFYYPAFRHSVIASWYPSNTQQYVGLNWFDLLSGISQESFYTKYSNPDSAYNGVMPGELTFKLDPNAKHHYTWTSVNK
jgi:hypothetical protein